MGSGVPECQYCGTDLDDKYNFCLNCNRQVKCLNCREVLVRDKMICLICGQPLVSQTGAQGQVNEFTLEEDRTESSAHRRISGRFTDEAFGNAAALFGGLTQSRNVDPHPTSSRQKPLTPIGGPPLEQSSEHADEFSDQRDSLRTQETFTPDERNGSDRSRALKLFRQHGDNDIIPTQIDFKGESWKEQQRQFVILYVWAYNEILGHPVPSEENVFAAAKRVTVYDVNNTRRYYREFANEYLLSTDQGLELNTRGFQLVEEIVGEIEGSPEEEGFVYWKGTSKSGAKRSAGSKKAQEEVDDWVNKAVDIGDFDIRELRSARELGMFAIWSITKRPNLAPAVKPRMAYQYLTKKYTTVPVGQQAIVNAMGRNNSKFQRTADGSYYLTSQAQREVEAWIEAGTVEEAEA